MRTAIVGGAGQMGQWLADHLLSLGHSIIISDPALAKSSNASSMPKHDIVLDNKSAVRDADLVIISVPVALTADVIREITPHIREGSIICEISSIKANVQDALKEAAKKKVIPLCIHLMFGPGARLLKKKVLLVPVSDIRYEQRIVRDIFPGSEIIIVDAIEHDRAMALTLAIPYFINMIIGAILSNEDVATLAKLGGTTFQIQQILTGAIMAQSAQLHFSLQTQNPEARPILKDLESSFKDILTLTLEADTVHFERLYNRIRSGLARTIDLNKTYEDMYQILEFLERKEAREWAS